ncbi:hypothetical protein L5D93_21245 [Paenibacillus thiaminolyticus]|nr:hypothetical protein [Paenibacillus thiaminolyticus]
MYQTIQDLNKEKGYAITKLCTLAGVARSAYYKWLKWTPSARELENDMLAKEVKLRYDKRKGILGYRQMRTQLNRKLKRSTTKALLPNYACSWTQSNHSQEATGLRESP